MYYNEGPLLELLSGHHSLHDLLPSKMLSFHCLSRHGDFLPDQLAESRCFVLGVRSVNFFLFHRFDATCVISCPRSWYTSGLVACSMEFHQYSNWVTSGALMMYITCDCLPVTCWVQGWQRLVFHLQDQHLLTGSKISLHVLLVVVGEVSVDL